MLEVQLHTLGVGMEAVGHRAVGTPTYAIPAFLIAWTKQLISQMGGGEGRAS